MIGDESSEISDKKPLENKNKVSKNKKTKSM